MRFESDEMEPLSNNKCGRNLGIFIPDYIINDILVDVYASSANISYRCIIFKYIIQEFFAKIGLSLSCLNGFVVKTWQMFWIGKGCCSTALFH